MTESSPALRRRGAALTTAIFEATLAEMAERGFPELTFERVAARAGAGKTSLYRRWSTPAELLTAALTDETTGVAPVVVPDTGSVRTDLLAVLGEFARELDEPYGLAIRALIAERERQPELFAAIQQMAVRPRIDATAQVLTRGAARGEVAPDAGSRHLASVGPALVISTHQVRGTLVAADVAAVVDEVVLRLVRL